MQTLKHILWVCVGVVGAVACSPNSADAKAPRPITAPTETMAKQVQPPVQMVKLKRSQNTHIIDIHKMKFQTRLLNVKIGDTVTWVNRDIVPHTATALDKSWDSGSLKKGESFSLIITDETSLAYYCSFHRQMKAKLVLRSPQ